MVYAAGGSGLLVRVRSADARVVAGSWWGRSGTQTARSADMRFFADVSILGLGLGDMAQNSNAGLACGQGPVVCDGTSWKNVYTGAVYTP